MSTLSLSTIGRTATAIAVAAALGLVLIALFFSIGGIFGPLNDVCVGLGGILSGALAWMLYPAHRLYAPRVSRFALATALVGSCFTAVGFGLVIFNFAGWFFAGLVTTFGYALIGGWLAALSYSALHQPSFPRALARFGSLAGATAATGVFAAPGIIGRSDAIGSAGWFDLMSLYLGGLGWNILYAIWCAWLGRLLLSQRLDLRVISTAKAA